MLYKFIIKGNAEFLLDICENKDGGFFSDPSVWTP